MPDTHPFKCPRCPKRYKRKFSLVNHQRIHSGERPFRCGKAGCSKTFTSRDLRRTHEATHSPVKNYTCATCEKAFSRSAILRKHEKTVHACTSKPVGSVPSHPDGGRYYNYDFVLCNKSSFSLNGIKLFEFGIGDCQLQDVLRTKWQSLVEQGIPPAPASRGLHVPPPLQSTLPDSTIDATRVMMQGNQWRGVMEKEIYSAQFYARAWFIAAQEGNVDALQYLHVQIGVPLELELIGHTAAHMVASRGHHSALLYLMASGADLTPKGEHAESPLTTAIFHHQKHCAITLLNHSSSMEFQRLNYCLSIWDCALDADPALFRAVLSRTQGNINEQFAPDGIFETCLVHLAARQQDSSYLAIALEFGADVFAKNKSGGTVLHVASACCSAACMSFLLEKYPQLSTYTDDAGQTAFHSIGTDYVGVNCQNIHQCLNILLDYCDVNARDHRGNTPLLARMSDLCQMNDDLEAGYTEDWKMSKEAVVWMLRHEVSINVVNQDGESSFDIGYRVYKMALRLLNERVKERETDIFLWETERSKEGFKLQVAEDFEVIDGANMMLSMLVNREAYTGKAIARFEGRQLEDTDSEESSSVSAA